MFPYRGRPRVRLRAPSAFFTLKPRRYRASSVDPEAAPPGPSLELLYPSAFGSSKEPFFHFPFRKSVRRSCHPLRRSHPQGLATLSVNSRPSSPGSLFQLPTLLGFTLQSFSPPQRSKRRFHPFSPLPRFAPKPHRPRAGASAAFSRHGSRAPLQTGWIKPGRDPCFLGPCDLPGSPSTNRMRKASLLPHGPPGVGFPRPSRNEVAPPTGRSQTVARHLPFQDAGLLGLPADCPRTLFEPVISRGLFFHLRSPEPLAEPKHPFFAGDAASPFGRA